VCCRDIVPSRNHRPHIGSIGSSRPSFAAFARPIDRGTSVYTNKTVQFSKYDYLQYLTGSSSWNVSSAKAPTANKTNKANTRWKTQRWLTLILRKKMVHKPFIFQSVILFFFVEFSVKGKIYCALINNCYQFLYHSFISQIVAYHFGNRFICHAKCKDLLFWWADMNKKKGVSTHSK
jgi:hypothetical protein